MEGEDSGMAQGTVSSVSLCIHTLNFHFQFKSVPFQNLATALWCTCHLYQL